MRERERERKAKKRVIHSGLFLGGTIFLQKFFSNNLWFFHSNLRSTISVLSPVTMPKTLTSQRFITSYLFKLGVVSVCHYYTVQQRREFRDKVPG